MAKLLYNYGWRLLRFVLLSMLLYEQVFSITNCTTDNSLTSQQNTALAQFTTASYLSLSQHIKLSQAYSTLSTINRTYLIELESQFNFTINDRPKCNDIPQDVTFTSMDDVWVCFTSTFMVLQCNKKWELKIGCGTMIEIHRPFNVQMLGNTMLSKQSISIPFSISVVGLCAGTYHLWFVYSTRVGKIIKSVKPIFISYPPCTCQ